ncbi:hypothetical protein HY02_08085 [Peptococcaceae bacterium SCADC1_2_3]|nr:hypothetical protein DK28_0203475 [Peptococcaceae bacterium SCADC1_2_3]KFI35854.1 hypothetical protein HY00_00890 [Peptococcaceae bacterium SCADC1_2_3]KFI37325.1 hypothetical protein HY02_08085 [Peptococcaceae bacterium SCADC1_2_3]HBQ28178.1 type II toxin-antitoxin system VapC family toxin [Desulfotomaculum sp.]
MDALVIDTDVVSFLFKRDTRAWLYRPYLQDKYLVVSFMTVAELYQWAYIRRWGKKRLVQLELVIKKYIVPPFDVELCRIWAGIRVERQAKGAPISVQDAWIAATALRYGIPLVTHNNGDFKEIDGLIVVSIAQEGSKS